MHHTRKWEKTLLNVAPAILPPNIRQRMLLSFFTGGFNKPIIRPWSVKDDSTVTGGCLQSFISVPGAMPVPASQAGR